LFLQQLRQAFFGNARKDILSGMTVAFALIPEAIAFSLLAGVNPIIGLLSSVTIAVSISIFGGRPGMISAATGAMSSLMGPIVIKYGVEYLFATSILTGVLQWVFGMCRFGKLIQFVPHSVVIGFVNALAIIIFMAQMPNFHGESWPMYFMVAGTLAIIYLFPLLTKAVPSALVAIIVMTIISVVTHTGVRTVGDMGDFAQALPQLHMPQIDFSLMTLLHLLPYALALSVVGMTETLLTSTIVDDMTETKSDKNKEIRGQGIANFITGCFGGMAGCAMIGQTVINVKSGGRKRLSTLVAGVFLLILIVLLKDVVRQVPMAALVGVMFMVSIGTFDWKSLKTLHKIPLSDSLVMIITVVIVVATSNLAIGVVSGVVLSALNFMWKLARLQVKVADQADGVKVYQIAGPMFFGTMLHFSGQFDYYGDPERVVVDFTDSHIWDHSAVTAIAKVKGKYESQGKKVKIVGLNEESKLMIDRIGLAVPGGGV
jgi:SulP family sulfate permease